MTMVTPGNGYLRNAADAPAFSTSPIVLFGEITGRTPNYLFRGDTTTALIPASPALTLAANGGALVNQAFPGPGLEGEPNDSPLMMRGFQYTNTNATYHAAASPSILEIDGTESVSFALCFRKTADSFPLNAGAIFGQRQATGLLIGHELTLNTGGVLTYAWKGQDLTEGALGFSIFNSAAGQHVYADGRWHVFVVEIDVQAGQIRAATEHAGTMTAAWTPVSLVSGTTFHLGAVRAFAAGPFQLAWLAASFGQTAMTGNPYEVALALAAQCALVTRLEHRGEQQT